MNLDEQLRLIEPEARVTAPCPHFGPCGGCQFQDVRYDAQVEAKRALLASLLAKVGGEGLPEIVVHRGEPYGYRNRIRLRVLRRGDVLRFGYNAAAGDPLAIDVCLIAAPVLWAVAQSLLAAAVADRDAAFWLAAASEVELFCNQNQTPENGAQTAVQVTLLCAPRTKVQAGSLARALAAFRAASPVGAAIMGASAIASDARSGPTGRALAEAGSAGLPYRVLDETYWTLVELVTDGRRGGLAWDLFAGVGLFSRVLARSFAQVVAVEASLTASADNRTALAKLSAAHRAVGATALEFLQRAVLQRERPELVVLDPPRAGAGVEACGLLARLGSQTIVYVSCDPTTLARDLIALQGRYRVGAVHLVDLFPQTSHLETVVVLERR
jgi:23S rRNA (uracil1939-C5)-methyltransferase